MNITKEQIDDLNAVVKVAISKEDYQDKVEKILKDYRKQANIPGFRKGQVPMGLIKKQYGKAVLVDEVNKLLQDNLNKYLTEEKLDVLGNPLPKQQDNFDWDKDNLDFEFELGLAPSFDVNLKTKKAVTQYKIVADKKMIEEQVERIQKQYGKLISKTEVGKKDEITGFFANEEEEIDHKTTLEMDKIKSKKAIDTLVGKKVGDSVTLNTKGNIAIAGPIIDKTTSFTRLHHIHPLSSFSCFNNLASFTYSVENSPHLNRISRARTLIDFCLSVSSSHFFAVNFLTRLSTSSSTSF